MKEHDSIEAVVFDSDGTLLNSVELIVAAYLHLAITYGYEAPTISMVHEQMRQAKGLPDIINHFFPGADAAELLRANSSFIGENAAKVAAYEGLEELLQTLHNEGLKMAVLTGGGEKINELFEFHDVRHYFASVVHSGRVTKHKPDPEGYLLAAKEAGFDPKRSIMVGDSLNDIMVGKNAHAFATIGITHGLGTWQQLEDAGADYIVNSLFELRDVLAKINQ